MRRAMAVGLALLVSGVAVWGVAVSVDGRRQVVRAAGFGGTPSTSSGAAMPPPAAAVRPNPAATVTPRTLDHRPRVAFFGDSIGSETDPHVASLLAERGADYRFDGYPGTATCDYLDEMHHSSQDFRPDVVVLLFTGNALTPCITGRSRGDRGIVGGDGPAFDLSAFESAYLEDTLEVIDAFDRTVDVVLVGLPPSNLGAAPGRPEVARQASSSSTIDHGWSTVRGSVARHAGLLTVRRHRQARRT
jgi:hypothetical protein